MQKVFIDTRELDIRCVEKLFLSEDILMENAARDMYDYIISKFKPTQTVLIVAGSGDNGADGIALARMLHPRFAINLFLPLGLKSKMANLQFERAKAVGVKIVSKVIDADIIVDAIFGAGFNKSLSEDIEEIISQLNLSNGYKIACDVPSGLNSLGNIESIIFKADCTITMGAPKLRLFSDYAKDYVGDIIVGRLGLDKVIYEIDSNYNLLEESDFKPPYRAKKSSNKGEFGHLLVIGGEKIGASIISAKSALAFGAGVVSLLTDCLNIPYEIIKTNQIANNVNAVAIGMGLGQTVTKEHLDLIYNKRAILDADIFHNPIIKEILENKSELILTPHPKEFASLLQILGIKENLDAKDIQQNRFNLSLEFSKLYPETVLILKGSNTIIAHREKLYINSFGTSMLSKAGSGDVLSGLIGAMLAQGYTLLESALTSSLAQTLALKHIDKSSFALTPLDLIEAVSKL